MSWATTSKTVMTGLANLLAVYAIACMFWGRDNTGTVHTERSTANAVSGLRTVYHEVDETIDFATTSTATTSGLMNSKKAQTRTASAAARALKSKGMSKGSKGSTFDPCVTLEEFDTKKSMMGMMMKSKKKKTGSKGGMMMKKRTLAEMFDSEMDQDNDQEIDHSRALKMGSKKSSSKGMMMMMMKKKKKNADIFVSSKSDSKGKSKGGKGKGASVPTLFCSDVPSAAPSISSAPSVSSAPSAAPTSAPSDVPSKMPSDAPSNLPSLQPSDVPSKEPSNAPSSVPSKQPSNAPSNLPSSQPSDVPSKQPSNQPSFSPSSQPSNGPSALPSTQPSNVPSGTPSDPPTNNPTVSAAPTNTEPAEFVLVENIDRGQCRISDDGQCFFSDEGDATVNYPAFGSCTVRLTKQATLDVIRFRLSTGDFLSIPGTGLFIFQNGPDGITVDRNVDLFFFADTNPFTVDGGFEICIVPE